MMLGRVYRKKEACLVLQLADARNIFLVTGPTLLSPPINLRSNRTFLQPPGDWAVMKFPFSVEFPSLVPGRGLDPITS
jgi:hypothetical protein